MFHVDAARGFEERGRISHASLAERARRASCEKVSTNNAYYCNAGSADWYWGYAYGGITRSIIMDEYVFTLSNVGLLVNDLAEPTRERASVMFAPML
jgi:hypothetical protein